MATEALSEAADHGAKAALPQMEFADFQPQLIWLVICFAVLVWIMAKYALPRVSGTLEHRRNTVDNDLDKAQDFRDQSETAETEYMAALAEARAKSQAMAQEAREKAAAKAAKEDAKADETIAGLMKDAEERIADMRKSAMSNLAEAATDTADELVKSLIGKSDKSSLASAVKAALKAE